MKAVIFLDIDGVLNSNAWFDRLDIAAAEDEYPDSHIDPEAVKRFDRLVDTTGAFVVLSSTWRLARAMYRNQAVFKRRGMRNLPQSVTPCLRMEWGGGSHKRGSEIEEWFKRVFDDEGHERVPFVVLDDLEEAGHIVGNLVLTDEAVGLTDADVEKALALFREQGLEVAS